MKVLYVVPPSTHFAGIERVAHALATGLSSRYRDRIDVTVLYCHRYPELSGQLPYHVIWEDALKLRTFLYRVGRWLRKERYDVVVAAQFEPAALLWLFHRINGGRARFVMHFHGNPKVEGGGSLRARFAFAFFNILVPRMHKVLAVSPSLAHYIKERIGNRGFVEYLPNPVRQFSGLKRVDRLGGPISFISIGRLAKQKGHDILIEAFWRATRDGLDAQLTIVGDGPEQLALTEQVRRLALQDRVRLAGKISDPAAELVAADCFVSASRWEGFGVAIVEALSAGLYVIATNCEFGPSDLIDCPEKGKIVPNGDVDALACALIEFAKLERMNTYDQTRRDAAAAFSLDNVVRQHAAMLASVSGRSFS